MEPLYSSCHIPHRCRQTAAHCCRAAGASVQLYLPSAPPFSPSSSLQLRDLELSQRYEDRSSESTFRDSRPHSQDNPEPPDLPMPTCFRSRSHSYLRAIQAGCSQDDDTASIDSGSPPPIETTVRTYSTSTGETNHPACNYTCPVEDKHVLLFTRCPLAEIQS